MRSTLISAAFAVVASIVGASPIEDKHLFSIDEFLGNPAYNTTDVASTPNDQLTKRGILAPGDTLRCGYWEYDAYGTYIQDAINEVKKKKDEDPTPIPPRSCYWLYCADNAVKISWCNESYDNYKDIPSHMNVAEAAKVIYEICGDGKKSMFSGTLAHQDGWFAAVSRGDCYKGE
ncbi:hypothetical protein BJY04DRAFT_212423 [Aspergillus karnatakaensis]|uniref:uncharacterized protein n=1 Tax=Aspergillus karnatakaensis TaxID=1810916 RepID=UPI003CCE0A47